MFLILFLFVSYVPDKRLEQMHEFFPNLESETIETGHWVHAEK